MIDLSIDEKESLGTLVISGSITIQNAQDLHQALMDATAKANRLVLNLEGVDRMDLAALQLLCSAHRGIVDKGKTLTLAGNLSETVKQTITESGFVGCVKNDKNSLWTGE